MKTCFQWQAGSARISGGVVGKGEEQRGVRGDDGPGSEGKGQEGGNVGNLVRGKDDKWTIFL